MTEGSPVGCSPVALMLGETVARELGLESNHQSVTSHLCDNAGAGNTEAQEIRLREGALRDRVLSERHVVDDQGLCLSVELLYCVCHSLDGSLRNPAAVHFA